MSIELSGSGRLVLRRYVLGQLSPEEQDQVEEQFADPDYFAAYQGVARSLVQEYAGGTMAPVEADLFARNYLVTKKRRDQVLIARALSEVYYRRPAIQPTRSVRMKKWIPVLAMAASVMAAAVVVSHRLSTRPIQTASVRPVKPRSTVLPEPLPPPSDATPPIPSQAAPPSKAASAPTPEVAQLPGPEPAPIPPAESSPPPISAPELPPSQPAVSTSRALTAPPGMGFRSRPVARDQAPPALARDDAGKVTAATAEASLQRTVIPVRTNIYIRTIDPIDSDATDTSRDYAARLDDPVLIGGVEAVPTTARAILRVTKVTYPWETEKQSPLPLVKRVTGGPRRASMSTALVAVIINGFRVEVKAGEVDSELGEPAKGTGTGTGSATGATGGSSWRTLISPATRFTYKLMQPLTLPPAGFSMGMSIDQVLEILGPPKAQAGDGREEKYTYENLKLTFVYGKLTSVE